MGNRWCLSVCLFVLLASTRTATGQITPQIAGGEGFTCALGASGRVFCWGNNTSGQIGNGAGMGSGATSRVSMPVEMAGGFTRLAGGFLHSCGLMGDGSAYCWGSDGDGQLGSGSNAGTAVSLPVRVRTSIPFTAITAGGMTGQSGVPCNGCNNLLNGEHTCALSESGLAFCWGMNAHGQLGFGPATLTSRRSLPAPVSAPDLGAPALQFQAISAGGAHTCAIESSQDVWCWGSNVGGRAGLPNCGGGTNWALQCVYDRPVKVAASLPTPNPGLKFTAISAGTESTCGIDTSGVVQCWGQLFRGSTLPPNRPPNAPSPVALASPAVSVSVGATSACAVDSTGGLFCWGKRDHGQVGDGMPPSPTAGTQVTPVRVSGTQDYVAVSVGFSQACGLTRTGGVRCWGFVDADHLGPTGAATIGSASPVDVIGLQSTQLSFGGDHTCSTDPLGITSCWGDNKAGQIGHGQAVTVPLQSVVPTPVARSYLTALTALPASPPEVLFPQAIPVVRPYCWGQDALGQIGNGNRSHAACRFGVGSANTCVPFPTIVSRASSDVFTELAAGAAHNCARDGNKFVRCWGSAGFGELGSPITVGVTPTCANNANHQTFCRAPILVALPFGNRPRMVALATNDSNSCAVNESAEIWCWGNLGWARPPPSAGGPVQMPYPSGPNYVRIGLGGSFVCAGAQNGAIQCLGDNNWGQLGDGTNTSSATPTIISGNSFTSFANGTIFSCGIDGGSVFCWGDNSSGQLGDGTNMNSNVPIPVLSINGVTAASVGVGFSHSCAIDNTGATFCWGSNMSGELGDGNSNVVSSAPVAVAGGWKIP
jgi:alpha-tubulin suppressor-like RCC1 family protein